MTDIDTVISNNIQNLIKTYRLTHAELAKIADVTVSTVGKWILKKATPRMSAIQKISLYFNLPRNFILTEENMAYSNARKYQLYTASDFKSLLTTELAKEEKVHEVPVPDMLMGDSANDQNTFILEVNSEAMNQIFPMSSYVFVKSINEADIKDGDVVVYSHGEDYFIRKMYDIYDQIVFKPKSEQQTYLEKVFSKDNCPTIHGKVIKYMADI